MPFPNAARVLYTRNPLVEVICQLRFPTILRVGSDAPVAFQDRVRDEYPEFRQKPEISLGLPREISDMLPQEVLSLISGPRRASVYDFVSKDGHWTIGLAADFIALSTNQYVRWEAFLERLRFASQALMAVYQPSHYVRVGLRYRNIIDREALALGVTPWAMLLQPHIAGELSALENEADILDVTKTLVIKLPEHDSQVRMQHGTVLRENRVCYFIDNDFFTHGKTELDDAEGILRYFNQQSGRAFRWSITDALHRALEPGEL